MNQTEKDFIKLVLEDERFNDNTKKLVIESIFERHRDQLDDELKEYLYRQYAGAALQLGSAFMPAGSLGKAGIQVGEQLLKKSIGRKLSQEIGAGAAVGMGSGAVFGAGRGISENKNPILTAVTDALTGLFSGGALGAIGGNIQKAIKKHLLTNYNISNNMTPKEMQDLKQLGKEYYKNYLEQTQVNNNLIGPVNFPKRQSGEIRLHNYPQIPNLQNQIKNAKISIYSNDKPNRGDALYFNKLYNSINNKHYEYVIRKNKNKPGNDFYQIKQVDSSPAYPDQTQINKTEPNNIINDIINTDKIFSYDDQEYKSVPNNIITNNSTNIKSENANLNNNSISKIVQSFLAAGISKNVYDKNHIFTPEEIGAMTQEEFEENEDAIMEQMAKGQIRPTARDYSNFKNPYNGDDRIFSREDIDAMTTKEFEENEQAIYAQMKSIGVPHNSELAENARRNGVVYVRAYKREDGTEVKGYYRSLPRY